MGFQCGFYEELDELRVDDSAATFGFLENLHVTSESTAFNFLHGSCADFAAILSDVFGYRIECVRNDDGRLIHAYCVSQIGNEKAYIDVRGITTNPVLFYSEFENELSYYPPFNEIVVLDEDGFELEAKIEVWSDKNEGFDGEFDGWDDPEIESFIKGFVDYYDSGRYMSVYKCKSCGSAFEEIDDEECSWFEDIGEETLWGHIQLVHPDLFEEYQGLETPDMLEVCYDHTIEKKSIAKERLTQGEDSPATGSQSLDAMISDARGVLSSLGAPEGVDIGDREAEKERPRKHPDAPVI